MRKRRGTSGADAARLLPPAHREALARISAALADLDRPWAVTGSAGFALQGVPVAPQDLDLQSDVAGAYAIERRLTPHVRRRVAFTAGERIRSHLGAFEVDGVPVEVMGGIERRDARGRWRVADFAPHLRLATVGALAAPVLDLAYELEAYRELGRAETVALLEAWLRAAGER